MAMGSMYKCLSTAFASTPTLDWASAARRTYMSKRDSLAVEESKNLVCSANKAAEKAMNLEESTRSTASAVSWVMVDDGCHGWVWWRTMMATLGNSCSSVGKMPWCRLARGCFSWEVCSVEFVKHLLAVGTDIVQ